MQLTQKETSLLKDLKDQEQLCVDKYNQHASQANDPQLKSLFTQIGQVESGHLDTVNQILSGTVPSMQSGSSASSGGSSQMQQSFTQTYSSSDQSQGKQKDSYLCTDLLSTEKHVSSTYNTSIFEFSDSKIRDVLNHIQKEEQQHGEQIYNYMSQNGMYN